MAIEKRKEWLHLHFHFMWCTIKIFVDSSFMPSVWRQNASATSCSIEACIVECISLFNAPIKLPADGAVLNSKCQVHIGSDASFKCRDDSTYTYSCQVCEGFGNGGSPRSPLRHTDSHHQQQRQQRRRVSSARRLRSNFQTCLNDHRK